VSCANLIESCNAARIGLVAALGDVQGRELLGDVEVRLFGRRRSVGVKSSLPMRTRPWLFGKGGERDLPEDRGLPMAEGSGDGAIGKNIAIHQGATAAAILSGGSGAAKAVIWVRSSFHRCRLLPVGAI
jgi:hypothetical protein